MLNEWNFIVAAYALTWATLIGYGVYLGRRYVQARRAAAGGKR